jgi:hypothetical protein
MLLTFPGLVLSSRKAESRRSDSEAPFVWAAFLTISPALRVFPFASSHRTDSGTYLKEITSYHSSMSRSQEEVLLNSRREWNQTAEMQISTGAGRPHNVLSTLHGVLGCRMDSTASRDGRIVASMSNKLSTTAENGRPSSLRINDGS